MSDRFKKILLITFIVVLAVGIAFMIWWVVNNYSKVEQGLSGSNLYTAEDLENAKKEGYEEGINSLKTLENQIADLKTKLENKTNESNNLNKQVIELTSKVVQLQNDKINANAEIENLNAQIHDLNNQISYLNGQIEEYVVLLDAYSEYVNRTYVVTFYNKDNSVLKSVVVDKNSVFDVSLLPTAPELESFTFLGWSNSANSSEIVSFDNLVVNSNMKFYAVYKEIFNVNLVYGDSNTTTYSVLVNDLFTLPTEVNSLGSFIFKGWVLAENDNLNYNSKNSTLYSNNEINVNSNMTFVAVYGLESGNYQYLNESEVEAEITVGEFYFSDFSALESLDSKYLPNYVQFIYSNPFSDSMVVVRDNFTLSFYAESLNQTNIYFDGEFVDGVPINEETGIAFIKISD